MTGHDQSQLVFEGVSKTHVIHAVNMRSCLGSDKFEQLQVMRFLWCSKIVNYASINSAAVLKEVDFSEFKDLFSHDVVEAGLNSSWINKKGPFAL
jgi:hypothetical protein